MLKLRISYDDVEEANKILKWIASGAYIRKMKQKHGPNHSLIYLEMEKPKDLVETMKEVQRSGKLAKDPPEESGAVRTVKCYPAI